MTLLERRGSARTRSDLNGVRVLLATTLVPDDRKTLACARSLGRAGAWVAVAGDASWGQAYHSRFVRRRCRTPHPARDPAAWADALAAHAHRERIDVVLPMNDHTTAALSRLGSPHMDGLRTALSSPESVDLARDKQRTLALAAKLGLDVPVSHAPASEDEWREVAATISYPCVCKPSTGSGADGVAFPRSAEELLAHARASQGSRMLVQELVPGEVCDAVFVLRHGEPRAALTQRRRWMYPHAGGMGVSVEITHEPELLDQAARLLRELRWHGPACVEFRVDERSGRAWVLEINGRLGGASGAGIAAGVDYPSLWTRLALDGDVEPVTQYDVGLRFRWPLPFGILALGSGAPLAALREFFVPARRTRSDLDVRDPVPHLAEIAFGLRRMFTPSGRSPATRQRSVASRAPRR